MFYNFNYLKPKIRSKTFYYKVEDVVFRVTVSESRDVSYNFYVTVYTGSSEFDDSRNFKYAFDYFTWVLPDEVDVEAIRKCDAFLEQQKAKIELDKMIDEYFMEDNNNDEP